MIIDLFQDETIRLTIKEISILSVLAQGPTNGYAIAKRCAEDSGNLRPMSRGSLYPALGRLELARLIQKVVRTDGTPNPGKPRVVYELTPIGRVVLEWNLDSLARLVELARERLR